MCDYFLVPLSSFSSTHVLKEMILFEPHVYLIYLALLFYLTPNPIGS